MASDFLSRMSWYIFTFILPSLIWSVGWWKTNPHFDVPTCKRHCSYSVMKCLMTSKWLRYGVFYGIQRVKFGLIWPENLKQGSICFFSSEIESCVVSVQALEVYLFSLRLLYILIPSLSVAFYWWSLALGPFFW